MKILIAEDDAIVRKYLVTIAKLYGYECLEATDGREALAVFSREKPDVVLSDYQMQKPAFVPCVSAL